MANEFLDINGLAHFKDKIDQAHTQELDTALAGKQDVIQDLESIRAGASAGATAYQKPSGGIPSSDMSDAVRASLGKADTALQSFTEADPTVPAWAKAANPPTEVFVAEYGVTTYAELEAAIEADKFVLCKYNENVYMLNYKTAHDYRFYFVAAAYVYELRCTDADVWSNGYQGLQRVSDKVTSWQSTPDDIHYPSEKLVYDSIEGMITSEEQSSIPDPTNAYYTKRQSDERYCKWGVVSQTQTWTQAADGGYDYTMSDQVYGFIPKANIDLYEAAGVGAVFNENTGYFELNELTDISYEEIRRIYAKTIGGRPFSKSRDSQFAKYDERTTVQLSNPAGYSTSINHMFQTTEIHIAYLTDCNNLGATANTFSNANRLKKVIGILNASSWNDAAFRNCFSLESVTIRGLRSNIFFQQSQRLSLASVVHMVTYAANTSAITITLHATAYARCQADTTEYTYNGQTYTGILAYASAKNITIASA